VSEPDRITSLATLDQVATGLANFYRQFADKPNLQAIARAWLRQIQAIEDTTWEILSLTIDNADDDALAQYGEILLFPRGTLSTAAYRAVLKAIVQARKSSSTPEDIIAVAGLALASTNFAYDEGFMSIEVEPHAPIGYEAAALLFVLNLARAGAVRIEVFDPPRAESSLFTFSSSEFFEDADASRGFSDETETSGGYLTGVL
jgi:hypothetical protein